MDGRARKLSHSLQARLALALTMAILVVAVGAGCFGFIAAYRDSIRMQDDLLMQVGSLLAHARSHLPQDGLVTPYPGKDHESWIAVQWLPPAHAAPSAEKDGPLPLPSSLHDGFQTVHMMQEDFRVYVQPLPSGRRLALSQETDARNHIALRSAWRTLIPVLILVPILLLAVHRITRKLFAPVRRLQQEIDQRRDDQLDAIPTRELPTEIRPLVDSVNRLLARIQGAMTAQRRFVADAAHELRTPLAALSLQAERLQESDMSDHARERLQRLGAGIERAKALVNQLLALARSQAAGTMEAAVRSRFPLREVVRPVLEELLPLAQEKEIDLGADTALDAEVSTNALELGLLLSNLIDNAIRYTPDGGRISLAVLPCTPGMVRLDISDSGPGIAAAERERVFQPFYRLDPAGPPGSGLGLSIVQSVAARLGILVRLEASDAHTQGGLRVVLQIPAASAGPDRPSS